MVSLNLSPAPAIDLNMAAQFLDTLAGRDAQHVFQTFCNNSSNEGVNPKVKRKGINPNVLVGTLSQHAKQLERINQGESGIFVVINETNGGRKAADVTRVRALFADWDVVGTGLPAIASCGLKPHAIVESSLGKFHAYWLVNDCSLDDFTPLQKAIAAKLGSDPAINNKDRVMRLPGFLHHKYADNPYFQTRIAEINNNEAYTTEEIKQGLGLDLNPASKTLPSVTSYNSKYIANIKSIGNNGLDRIRSALFSIPKELAENRDTWKEVAMAMHSESDVLFDDFLEWSKKAKNHDANACDKLWDSFSEKPSGGITIATLFYLAKTHGDWKDTSYISERLAEELLTDVGNGHRLVRNNIGDIRYCRESKSWIFWNSSSGRWEFSSELIMRLAEDTTFKMFEEASERAQSGNSELSIATYKHAMKSQSLKSLKNQIEHAQSVQGVSVGLNQLDADPYLLCVLNGTVNLKTGMLRESKREDLITKQALVVYDNSAQCPTWLNFLNRIFANDTEMIHFVQRAIGYSLTGLCSEQALFIAYGFGANGKSVLLNVIAGLLGDHASSTQSETLMMKQNASGANNDIARLRAARFVSTSEVEDGKRLAESQVKQLTGGDLVTARFLYGEYFEYKPMFKIWLAANHRPIINGDDYGIWRRIILLPFSITIPEGGARRPTTEQTSRRIFGYFKLGA